MTPEQQQALAKARARLRVNQQVPTGPAPFTVNETANMSPLEVEALTIGRIDQTPFEQNAQAGLLYGKHLMNKGMQAVSPYVPETPPEALNFMRSIPSVAMVERGLEEIGGIMDAMREKYPRLYRDAEVVATVAPFLVGNKLASNMRNWKLNASTPYLNQKNVDLMLTDGRMVAGRGFDKISIPASHPVTRKYMKTWDTVPGVKMGQTNAKRLELVNSEIGNASRRLDDMMNTMKVQGKGYIPKKRVFNRFSNIDKRVNDGLEASEFLTRKERLTILKDVQHQLDNLSAEGRVHVADLHKYRQMVDKRFREARGRARADGASSTEIRAERIWKAKRDTLNDIIDQYAPKVAEERSRISTLYDLRDMTQQKVTKGNLSYSDDIMQAIPGGGADKIKILPRGGR